MPAPPTHTAMCDTIRFYQAADPDLSLEDAYRQLLDALATEHDTHRLDIERKNLTSFRLDGVKKALWRVMLQLRTDPPTYRNRPFLGQQRSWGYEAP